MHSWSFSLWPCAVVPLFGAVAWTNDDTLSYGRNGNQNYSRDAQFHTVQFTIEASAHQLKVHGGSLMLLVMHSYTWSLRWYRLGIDVKQIQYFIKLENICMTVVWINICWFCLWQNCSSGGMKYDLVCLCEFWWNWCGCLAACSFPRLLLNQESDCVGDNKEVIYCYYGEIFAVMLISMKKKQEFCSKIPIHDSSRTPFSPLLSIMDSSSLDVHVGLMLKDRHM